VKLKRDRYIHLSVGYKWCAASPGQISVLSNWGVTRLDGSRGKKQRLAPRCSNLRSFGSKCAALKKVGLFVTFLDFSASTAVIRRRAIVPRRYAPAHTWQTKFCAGLHNKQKELSRTEQCYFNRTAIKVYTTALVSTYSLRAGAQLGFF